MYDALLENILYWIEFVYKVLMSLIVKLGAISVIIGIIAILIYCLYLGLLVFVEYERECRWSIQRYVKTSEGKFVKIINYDEVNPRPEKKKKKILNEDAKEENLF